MVQTAKNKQKIGLLGGTFDPVHNGHLAVAAHVHQKLGLDSVLFMPASQPPHKAGHADGQPITGFDHRLAMLKLATVENSSFVVSDIEAQRTEPSYTIDTINILIPHIGKRAELYFIIGIDAFLEIDTWKRFRDLPDLVHFVIISRPTYSPDRVGEVIRRYFDDYVFDPGKETWSSPHNKGYFILQHMKPVPISSTDIRERIRSGESITGLFPPTVEDYISQQGLYK